MTLGKCLEQHELPQTMNRRVVRQVTELTFLEEIIENFVFLEMLFIKQLVLIFTYVSVTNPERQSAIN